jgi:hypothetical protein
VDFLGEVEPLEDFDALLDVFLRIPRFIIVPNNCDYRIATDQPEFLYHSE